MNERIEKIKKHIKENRKVYVAAIAGAAIGAVGVIVLKDTPTMVSIKETLNFKWRSPTTNNVIVFPALGDPGNVVQVVETGTIYASQGQAARELGVSATEISQHLNGKNPDVKGKHLKVLGKAGQPLAA